MKTSTLSKAATISSTAIVTQRAELAIRQVNSICGYASSRGFSTHLVSLSTHALNSLSGNNQLSRRRTLLYLRGRIASPRLPLSARRSADIFGVFLRLLAGH
jgi:hypothetical protein